MSHYNYSQGLSGRPRTALTSASRARSLPRHHNDANAGYPVSYSGTQVNILGAPPAELMSAVQQQLEGVGGGVPTMAARQFGSYPYGQAYPPAGFTGNVQLGLVTEHMIRKLDESRMLTISELMRRAYGEQHQSMGARGPFVEEPPSPRRQYQQAIDYPTGNPPTSSPGNGDWRGQLQYIYTHLFHVANEDKQFRHSIAEPTFGEIQSVDLEEGNDSYTVTLTFSKPRRQQKRPPTGGWSSRARSKVREQLEADDQSNYEKENVKQEGTLKPYKMFNAEADAEALRKSMKGLGTDEDAITTILGRRSNKQRQEVIRMYKTMFGKDLLKDLKGELSGEYWKLVKALCLMPADYDATELRNAIKGLGTDDAAVIEIICTRTNKSLQLIRESYKRLFSKNLEEDIIGDTSGHYQRLLVSLLQANRDESNVIDRTAAKKDAKLIYEAGSKHWGTDESRFNSILVSRSYPQLRAVFGEYEKLAGKSVVEAIKHEMSGDLANGMLTIVRCVESKPGYFARRLHQATKGLGTDDDTLIRVIASRCEVDTVQIGEHFQRQYRQPLARFIADDTSGDYQKLLLTLLGESNLTNRKKESAKSSKGELRAVSNDSD